MIWYRTPVVRQTWVIAARALRHYRRARIRPIRKAIANDWIGASRVAALIRSRHVGRGATSWARSRDMLRIASTALPIRCSALPAAGVSSLFMNAQTREPLRKFRRQWTAACLAPISLLAIDRLAINQTRPAPGQTERRPGGRAGGREHAPATRHGGRSVVRLRSTRVTVRVALAFRSSTKHEFRLVNAA